MARVARLVACLVCHVLASQGVIALSARFWACLVCSTLATSCLVARGRATLSWFCCALAARVNVASASDIVVAGGEPCSASKRDTYKP